MSKAYIRYKLAVPFGKFYKRAIDHNTNKKYAWCKTLEEARRLKAFAIENEPDDIDEDIVILREIQEVVE